MRSLETHLLPWLGKMPIDAITPIEILACIKRICEGNKIETWHKVLNIASRVFKYAKQHGKCQNNPASDLSSALPQTQTKHMPILTEPTQVGELLRVIEGFTGTFLVRHALRLAHLIVGAGLKMCIYAVLKLNRRLNDVVYYTGKVS